MNNGALVAEFHHDGMGWQLSALEGGTQMGYDLYYLDLWLTEVDVFLEMDWIAVEMNRDGEVIFQASPYLNLIGDYGVDGDFFGMAFPDSPTEWRVEATIDLDTIGIAGIAGLDLAGEFGSGPYNGDLVSYIGVRGEGNYMDYRVGGGVLFGTIYDSPVLRSAGYGELIDTLGDENTYTGIYLFVNGDFPIAESDSCMLKASGGRVPLLVLLGPGRRWRAANGCSARHRALCRERARTGGSPIRAPRLGRAVPGQDL